MSAPLHTVLGAGPAGTALTAELVARGHRVRNVNRSAARNLPDGVEAMTADVSHADDAVTATAGSAVIYHAVNVPYERQVDEMPRIATAILEAAATADARLVILDTLYPYGEADGDHITEKTPWAATSRKGRMRAALDQAYLDAHASGRVRVSAGRSADFYGPGVVNSTLGGTVFPAAITGAPIGVFGDIDLPHSYTYIGDVARGLAVLGERPEGDGAIWHLPTVPARSTRAVLTEIERVVGRPLSVEVISEPRPFGPFDAAFMAEYAEMFYQHTTPQNMVSAAFESAFGVHPTPFEEGIPATVDFYQSLLSS